MRKFIGIILCSLHWLLFIAENLFCGNFALLLFAATYFSMIYHFISFLFLFLFLSFLNSLYCFVYYQDRTFRCHRKDFYPNNSYIFTENNSLKLTSPSSRLTYENYWCFQWMNTFIDLLQVSMNTMGRIMSKTRSSVTQNDAHACTFARIADNAGKVLSRWHYS